MLECVGETRECLRKKTKQSRVSENDGKVIGRTCFQTFKENKEA